MAKEYIYIDDSIIDDSIIVSSQITGLFELFQELCC